MGSIWIRVRQGLRERAGSWVALAVVVGVLGGGVIGAVAGARRTESAYDRFLASQRAYQQFMFTYNPKFGGGLTYDQLRSLPEVETVVEGRIFDAKTAIGDLVLRGSVDRRLDRTLNAVNVLDGRLPEAVDEVLVPSLLAEDGGLAVGDSLVLSMTPDPSHKPIVVPARVAGIGMAPGEFPPEGDIQTGHWVHVSPAFAREFGQIGSPFAYVFLKGGDADLESFQRGLERLAGGQPVIGYQQASLTKNVRRAHHLQAISLWLLALLLGATAIALVGQTISRMTWADTVDHPVLSAVGMTRIQLFSAGLLRVLLVGLTSASVATGLAFVLSPLAPTGRARAAVLDPSFAFDRTAIGLGALTIVTLSVLLTVVPGWRSSRTGATTLHGTGGVGRSRLVDEVLRRGAPPTTGIGVRFALEPGRGRTAVPTRATMVGATLAVAAIAMTLTFGGSLRHLLNTPRLYGATYDRVGRSIDDPIPRDRAQEVLRKIRSLPQVEAATEGAVGIPIRVNGMLADGGAISSDDPSFLPPALGGRHPQADDEIMLASKTLMSLHLKVGDTAEVSVLGTPTQEFTVVGVGVIPAVGHSGNLGEGSLLSLDAIRAIFNTQASMGDVLIRLRPGADPAAAEREVARVTGGKISRLDRPRTPADLVSFGGQRHLPFVLAAILALMAVLTIGHALVSSISRRRRDIAILKSSGFTPRQARLTIAWQATTLMVVGIAFGLPIGIAVGRTLWATYAQSLGIISEPRPPFWWLFLTVPAALVLSNLIAMMPARRAARVEPAIVLRTE